MLKLTKTGIGLLTKQYRSVLKKCLLLNLGLFVSSTLLPVFTPNISFAVDCSTITSSSSASDIASCIGSFRGIPISTLDLTEGYYNNGNSTTSRWSSGVAVSVRNWVNADTYYLYYQQNTHNATVGYHTITPSATIADNLAALDQLIGGYPVYSGNSYANIPFLHSYKENNANVNSMDTGAPILTNLVHLDYVLGQLPSGTYVSNMQSMGDNVKALDTAIGAKIASDGHYIKKSSSNSITANLSALDYALYNYYYTFRNDENVEIIYYASFFK